MKNKSGLKGGLNENKEVFMLNERPAGFQYLQRGVLLLRNGERGRSQIKFGMTSFFDNNVRAFTLIELLVVVLIIGILAAVALPQYQKAVVKSRYATLKNLTHSIAQAQEIYYLANGKYATDLEELSIEMPSGKLNTSTAENYQYNWGNCHLRGTLVRCSNNLIQMQYDLYLQQDASFPGVRMCESFVMDANSIQAQVCKSETGTTGSYNQGYYLQWNYPR